jgi:macrolide transport system ATP-binding/permease protein
VRTVLRKLAWWVRRRRKEDQLLEELQFHLAEEAEARQANGLAEDQARWAARRDLGSVTRVLEETRTLWTWTPLEQLAQDVRYSFRTMVRNRTFTALATLSLALGIGANTAIYSFMDSILLRSLPVSDPASLVVVKWRSKPVNFGNASDFVLHSINGHTYEDAAGVTASIFPFPAFERLHQASGPVLSSLFAYEPAGNLTVMVHGDSQLAASEYVSGDFFSGLGIPAAAGRLIDAADDRAGAQAVAVISMGYCQRRFGDPTQAAGQPILINNVPFIVAGITRAGFFGVDPGAAPDLYLPLHNNVLLDPTAAKANLDPNYYWLQMMGRLRPGVRIEQARATLAGPFGQWVATTAGNERELANLPVLTLESGGGGLDSLKRKYTKPLYVLLTIVGLILAIACANTANLLLARAAARKREMAVRISIGAGRWRLVRQLLTESVLLASLAGALGILIAVWGIRVLTRLLANGQEGFTLHAELNWHVLVVTLGLSLVCGMVFGLAPALQSTRPALMPALNERSSTEARTRVGHVIPRLRLTQALVVTQIAISLLLLVAAGLFVRTLSNLQSIPLGFNRDRLLLFELNARQAGYPTAKAAAFYADVWRRLRDIPGVSDATLSHASLIQAGRQYPVSVNGVPARGTRILLTGPAFFSTLQIPMLRGRAIEEGDRQATLPVAVVSDLFARTWLGDRNPVGGHITVGAPGGQPLDLEIVGVAATVRYGGLKREIPPVVYLSYLQVPQVQQMTFALRTDGDPLRYANAVRQIVHETDAHVPVTHLRTQAAEIDQTITQEIIFARLCSAFAILALVIACVGLYATMSYMVARRTSEIGIRMALGARQGAVVWMVMREVCVLATVGLAISVPTAIGTSRFVGSFLFDMQPNDPRALTMAVAILVTAALVAGYGPARRASRVNPIAALRHE